MTASLAFGLAFGLVLQQTPPPPPAEQPPIANARLDSASAAGGLEAAVKAAMGKQTGPAWIGYAVAMIPGDGQACCWENGDRGCVLEERRGPAAAAAGPVRPIKLEGPTHATVLLRVEQNKVGKVRAFSRDCPLDAGGLPMHWLTAVKPAESVALLARLTGEASAEGRKAEATVHALAWHAGGEAQAALEKLAAAGPDEKLRKSAIFWLASARGRPGYQAVSRLAREDGDDKVREHAIFALTQTRDPEAIPAIIRIAREDKNPKVRKQAMFWLGQSKDPRATKFFEEILSR